MWPNLIKYADFNPVKSLHNKAGFFLVGQRRAKVTMYFLREIVNKYVVYLPYQRISNPPKNFSSPWTNHAFSVIHPRQILLKLLADIEVHVVVFEGAEGFDDNMIPVVSDVFVGLEQVGDFPDGDVHICDAPQKYEERNRREALSDARKCIYVCVNSRVEFARPVVRKAGAFSPYSPRAFMYSSKLSLEIIFQYPFRSTGMMAVSQLLSGRPVKQEACCGRLNLTEYGKLTPQTPQFEPNPI